MMDFALSNRCNLQCVMCNGGLSSAIRAHRERRPPLPAAYDDRFFDELAEFLPHLERAFFKGGEPFLAIENRRIWDELLRIGGSREVCVTTNGTIWNDRVERYVRELGMDVILSVDAVDGPTLEGIRVGVDAEQLWGNVDRFQAATASEGRALTLCMCLMSTNWRELHPFLVEVDRRGVAASVIWVDGPAQHDLLGLSPDALAEVRRTWEATASRAPALGEATAAIWDQARQRVDDALRSAPAAGAGVPVGIAKRPHAHPGGLDAYRSELAALCEGELLELDLVDEVIREVRAPDGLRWLEPTSWIGVGLDQFTALLAGAIEGALRYEVDPGEQGVRRSMVSFQVGAATTRLRLWYVPTDDAPGPRRSSILVGVAGPEGEHGAVPAPRAPS